MLAQGAVAPCPPTVMAAEASAVACRNVSVRFITDRRTVTALENIAFSVERGGFLTLLGPSGCGKSTLLRVVADLIAPTSGQVSVLGDVAAGGAAEARRSASCSRTRRCCPGARRSQNVELPLEVGGVAQAAARRAPTPRELLKLVGLDGWEKALPA